MADGMRIQCPHCRGAVRLSAAPELGEVVGDRPQDGATVTALSGRQRPQHRAQDHDGRPAPVVDLSAYRKRRSGRVAR